MEGILVMAKVDQDPATILRLGPALHVADRGIRSTHHF